MEDKTLYTVTIFSENTVGLLSQVTSVFTRRHCDEDMIKKVVLQIDKRVDVLKSYYNTNDELIHQEIALYKLSTPDFLKIESVEGLIRKYNARILDINENIVVLEKTGHYQETQSLFEELSKTIGVLQFIRSGRVAITKSKIERLSDMLSKLDKEYKPKE